MPRLRVLLAPIALVCAAIASGHAPSPRELPVPQPIVVNDNRVPAGIAKDGALEISLEASEGAWHPYGPTGPALTVMTFGEAGKALQTPGPLIRVREGTRIRARVHNALAKTLVVHGFSSHRTLVMDTLVVQAGATGEVAFTADEEGTFYYWGAKSGDGFEDRTDEAAFLNGAFIVDPRTGTPRADRVFVVQWYLPQPPHDTTPNFEHGFFTFNGRPWPYTERLSYNQGDSIRWRFINASADVHPLHLHGFYFRVTARGDDQRDTLYWPSQERFGVTEMLNDGTTENIAWYADRPGAWVFHCHLNFHVVPNPAEGADAKPDSVIIREWFSAPAMHDMHAMEHHAETGMGGLVLGINIKPSAAWKPYAGPRAQLRLYIQTDSQPGDTLRRFGYSLAHGAEVPDAHAIQWPGPPIILHKGKPASIWVINHSTEPSQVHWHGLEIDSYYDGVAGLSSNDGMVSPVIMPRDSFEVKVTPPRAGSFMYHTHINDIRQQSHGLYGSIIVLDSAETWDPEKELIFQVATDPTDNAIMNGSAAPAALTVHAGRQYRVRLMNVSLDAPFNEFWLTGKDGRFAQWTAIAKDGHDLPPWQRVTGSSRQRVSIGETYDFRVTFGTPGEYVMEGRRGNAAVHSRQAIHVVK
jgi:FtsP/CotA-like multicopper oxidase with cupredoxin domain